MATKRKTARKAKRTVRKKKRAVKKTVRKKKRAVKKKVRAKKIQRYLFLVCAVVGMFMLSPPA